MSLPTEFVSDAISVTISGALGGSEETGIIDDDVLVKANSYEHERGADGGYIRGRMSLATGIDEARQWVLRGLGRDVETFNKSGDTVWNGFVNQITVTRGPLVLSVGPLMEVANKVAVVYQTRSYNTNPPIPGERRVSDFVTDTGSVAKYGTLEMYISGGTGDTAEMEQARDVYLADFKFPFTSQVLDFQGGGQPIEVSLDLLGYIAFLNRYYYKEESSSGTENANVKIQNILGANPNTFFSSDYGLIEENTGQVGAFDSDENLAFKLIRDIVTRGDVSDNRWLFGLGADQQAYYSQVPSTFYYEHDSGDPVVAIYRVGGGIVKPWDIEPNQWLEVTDFGLDPYPETLDGLKENPAAIYIETVRYVAPWSYSINGGRVQKFAQKLAKMGLDGK